MLSKTLFAAALLVCLLYWSPARADQFRFGVMGDSLSDPYANYAGTVNPQTGLPYWGAAGDKNWVEQFQTLRGGSVVIDNQARAGATSADLLAQGQHIALADLVAHDNLRHAVLLVGANDILAQLQAGGDPTPALIGLNQNLRQAIDTVRSAGNVALVLGNIPNLAATPFFQSALTAPQLAGLTALVQAANAQIDQIRRDEHLPLIDLFGLGQVAQGPLTLGGTTLSPLQLFAPDFFHPGTGLQGLLANAYLDAEHIAYGTDITALRLSDQEIVGLATGTVPPGPATYFDVSGHVNYQGSPEPSTLALGGLAGAFLLVWRRRRVGASQL